MITDLLRFARVLELIHIPALDNVKSPWITIEPKADDDNEDQIPLQPAEEQTTENVITAQVGAAEPGKDAVFAQYIAPADNDAGDAWTVYRFDGAQGARYNFNDWTQHDEDALKAKGWTTAHRRQVYIDVRPHVLAKKSNAWVAKHFDKSMSWADDYCGAVRDMVNRRIFANKSPSPDREGGAIDL